jgi:hypothetical protein
MEDIIKKVYSHYISDNELLLKEKEILSLKNIQEFKYIGRNINLYYNENYFIKIDHRSENQEKYILNDNSLMLGKFPKEIIINNLLRKECEQNIIKINNYYFNNTTQILIMENAGITFKDLIMKDKNNLELINSKLYEIFILLAILQHKFKFMHKDLKCENILMKETSSEFNEYSLDGKQYKIKSYGYIPVLIDMPTSTIFKIDNKDFEIYDIIKSTYVHNINKFKKLINPKDFLNKYLWYIRDVNKYNPSFDIYHLIISINLIIDISKIKIIKEYFDKSGFTSSYDYSELLMNPLKFTDKYKIGGDENKIGCESENENESESESEKKDDLNIDEIVKNKENSRICILRCGLGNKLFIIANIINKNKNKKYQIYFAECLSKHQLKNSEKKLKYVFPEILNSNNPKIISLKNFDILKNKGVKKIIYNSGIFGDYTGFIEQKYFLQKYFRIDNNILTNKYDFDNGIFVHVRYGDKFEINYNILKDKSNDYFYTLLNESYYIDNINKLIKEKNGNIYIFTDSPHIAKCFFKNKIKNLIYINADVYEAFYCFTHCKRLIISESTLSIAAIYLNINKDLQAIVPNFSYDINQNIINTPFKYPSNIILENNKSYILNDIKDYYKITKECSNVKYIN